MWKAHTLFTLCSHKISIPFHCKKKNLVNNCHRGDKGSFHRSSINYHPMFHSTSITYCPLHPSHAFLDVPIQHFVGMLPANLFRNEAAILLLWPLLSPILFARSPCQWLGSDFAVPKSPSFALCYAHIAEPLLRGTDVALLSLALVDILVTRRSYM